jgi:replicative DNA helicase
MLDDLTVDDALALRIAAPMIDEDQAEDIVAAGKHNRKTVMRAKDFVLEARAKRDLRRAIERATSALEDRASHASTISAALMQDIADSATSGSMSTSAASVAADLRRQKRSEAIPTCIRALNYVAYGGLWPGQVLGLFARYKAGKTTMAATVVRGLERDQVPTLMVSLERRKNDIERFIIAASLDIDARDLDLGDGGEHDEAFEQYLADRRNLWYIHRPGVTIDQLRSMIIAEVHANKVKVVVVDYWQLITNPGSKSSQQEKQQEAAQMLADLASDLDIAILVMGQLNQEGQPRGGEGILASAGIVIRLNRPEESEDGFLETMVCNKGPSRSKGNANQPAVTLNLPGPQFRDWMPPA